MIPRLLFATAILLLFSLAVTAGVISGNPGGGGSLSVKKKDNDAGKLVEEGIEFIENGDYEKALECFDAAIKINDIETSAWFNRGIVLYKLERYEEAAASYHKVTILDKKDMHAWLNEGASLYMLSRFEEAIERFDKAIEIDSLHGKASLMKGGVWKLWVSRRKPGSTLLKRRNWGKGSRFKYSETYIRGIKCSSN